VRLLTRIDDQEASSDMRVHASYLVQWNATQRSPNSMQNVRWLSAMKSVAVLYEGVRLRAFADARLAATAYSQAPATPMESS
jgi:hypothetical protein